MRLASLVAALDQAFDPDLAMADVHAICAHDRYQASTGIVAAADYVADRAKAAGLADVTVLSFPADGVRRWWTYRAPLSWTPLRATLAVRGNALVSYPAQAYTLAAYSAPTPPGGRTLPLVRYSAARAGRAPRGALVVIDEPVALGEIAGSMAAAGAVAIAADPLSGRPNRAPGQVGRLELAPGSELAAFSVTAAQLSSLLTAADAGATAVADIELDDAVSAMPVVTGRLPGAGSVSPAGELLLSAHLCHPRPGANDNASGVAALLGIARVLAGWRQGSRAGSGGDVRFLWGPEFVGTIAYLHDVVGTGQAAPPSLAINIDMAGPEVARCGGPLVIERGPDDIASFLPALTARCAALLPAASRSYSGAVSCEPWTWRATPFAGGSDHALFADQPVRCPVVGLGHWPDLANHSSADTPELVDPAELKRTAVIAAATVAACGGDDAELAGDVAEATLSWAADHVLAVLPGHRAGSLGLTGSAGLTGWAGPAGHPGWADEPVLDPHADGNAVRWLRHRGGVGSGAVAALASIGVDHGWLRAAQDWVGALVQATAARLPASSSQQSPAGPVASADGRALLRCWTGPANVRALAEDATPADRDWLAARLAADRGGNYARALALLSGVNGARNRSELAWWAALSSELPIPLSFAQRFLDLASRAGWVRQNPGDQS